MNERIYAAYPNCIRDNRISMGDDMWCTDRAGKHAFSIIFYTN
jgi:hypothetical protein